MAMSLLHMLCKGNHRAPTVPRLSEARYILHELPAILPKPLSHRRSLPDSPTPLPDLANPRDHLSVRAELGNTYAPCLQCAYSVAPCLRVHRVPPRTSPLFPSLARITPLAARLASPCIALARAPHHRAQCASACATPPHQVCSHPDAPSSHRAHRPRRLAPSCSSNQLAPTHIDWNRLSSTRIDSQRLSVTTAHPAKLSELRRALPNFGRAFPRFGNVSR